MTALAPRQLYDRDAQSWRREQPTSLSDFTGRPAVFEMCGDVRGQKVIDLGCGEGYCARWLARNGAAEVLGLDISERMIALAEGDGTACPPGVRFHVGDVTRLAEPDGRFDLALAVFVFNYLTVAETEAACREIFRVLRPGGRFVFAVPHPSFAFVRQPAPPFFFEAPERGYFSQRDRRFAGQIFCRDGRALNVQMVHKTVADYFAALAAAGFTSLPAVREMTVRPHDLADDPAFFGPVADVPLHMGFAIRK